jgi:hypothetical protein
MHYDIRCKGFVMSDVNKLLNLKKFSQELLGQKSSILHESFLTLYKIKFFFKHGPQGVDGATIGETVFTWVYICKIFLKIFFSRTTGPEKLKFTGKLSNILEIQNQVCKNYGPRGSDGATYMCLYWKNIFYILIF